MPQSRTLAIFFVTSIAGCATDPPIEETTREWPCGSIETGGHYGLANVHARYLYDDLHNVVWAQETNNEEQSPNYGKVMSTETKTFEGRIAVAEELVAVNWDVAVNWHEKITRKVMDGRVVRSEHLQYGMGGNRDRVTANTYTYDGDRLVRVDTRDVTASRPSGYSTFSYPDDNTEVARRCSFDYYNGGEHCSINTLIGGGDTWTTWRRDSDADGVNDYEDVRTLDANGLALVIEGYVLDDTRTLSKRTVIERRPDGAPLSMDDGFTQTEYLFACE